MPIVISDLFLQCAGVVIEGGMALEGLPMAEHSIVASPHSTVDEFYLVLKRSLPHVSWGSEAATEIMFNGGTRFVETSIAYGRDLRLE